MGRPVLKVEIGSLGFGGGQTITREACQELREKLVNWLERYDEPPHSGMYVDGYRLGSVEVSLCDQLDDVHCVVQETSLVRIGELVR